MHGRLQPFKPQFNDKKLLSELIEYANTREIVIKVSDHDLNKILDTIEYTKLGYRDPDDLIANIHSGNKHGTAVITIIPNRYYLLGDMMENDINKPPCYKSKCYLRLIMDEFERIKIRACKLLNSPQEPDQLKFIALKNLRTAEYLLRESSAVCHFLIVPENDTQKRSLHYITDCLKKFLIKSIRFYYSLFDPFITEYFEKSEKLIRNIDQATSSNCIKYLYQEETENNLEESNEDNISYSRYSDISKDSCINLLKDNSNPIHNIRTNQNRASPILRWTGKINLLVSLFYDLTEKGIISIPNNENSIKNKKVSEVSNRSETIMNMVEFLYCNFLDNSGKRLSKDTLRTYLNPNKPDKRSQRSQDLNLDKYT